MKNILIFALILSASNDCLVAMNSQEGKMQTLADSSSEELTATEQACYDWFKKQQKTLPSSFQKLSPEDLQTFEKQVKYNDNPQAVILSRHHFAEIFYEAAQTAGLELPYDKELLKNTFVKMKKIMDSPTMAKPKDLLSARMYAFSMLSEDEKKAYSQENYWKNPDATKIVISKWSQLVCNELIKIKQLDSTLKDQKEQELFNEKIETFENTYKK